jgi:hypothetical protein
MEQLGLVSGSLGVEYLQELAARTDKGSRIKRQKTQKMPQREICQAKRNLADYREKNKDNERKQYQP